MDTLHPASPTAARAIALSSIPGLTLATARELCELTGGIDAFFELSTDRLWQLVGAQKRFCTDAERRASLAKGEAEAAFAAKSGVAVAPWTSALYPSRLALCDDAPPLLYRLGQCDLNSQRMVAVVGTRRCTPYGAQFTRSLIERLAEILPGTVIVSGLAYGVDVEAHKAALDCGLPTVGVVAHGLKTIYPAAHRDIAARMVRNGGAIVTEYTSDAPIHRGNFLARNRIVAGMCDATVVVESDDKGGAMVTASIAAAYGREVCAPPGRTTDRYSRGPNRLIATRVASLIRGADDLAALMNWQPVEPEGTQAAFDFPDLTPEMGVIIEHLRANPDATANTMVAALGIPYAKLSARLMEMEMDDFISSVPGGHFAVKV